MDIRLLVLRTGDTKLLADFYNLLGIQFEYHKHGNSPYHYSATIGVTVLEIYPLTKNQDKPDKNLRLGFGIENFDQVIKVLNTAGITFTQKPNETDFGLMTIIIDPDGRKIELYKNS
ncbi:glyoxalase/bleomycin resistance/extradiol dioxygenase family protein [Sphingobacteriaceae bacterium GW460-11-11-14-LB5]|nr:glyoxalase/bleomycin resistance/extradiol dioxygenase family protein [Sphingobacteriaceae bacterium GW460-11-11-14-LB5]